MNSTTGYRLPAIALVLALVMGVAGNAAAQDGTIEQLVATALDRSPEIRAACQRVG